MRKVLTFVGSIFLLILGMQAYAVADTAQPLSIAVVNVQQVLQQSPKIAELNKKLQSQFKPRQEKLDAAQKALQDELDTFKKQAQSPAMSDKEKEAMQKKVTDDRAVLVKQVVAFQQDLNKEQSKIMQGVIAQLNKIIATLSKKNGYTMVLDSQAVVYSSDKSDITKEVSKQFDEK